MVVPPDDTDYKAKFESYDLPQLIEERQRWDEGHPAHDALTNWIEIRVAENKTRALENSTQSLQTQIDGLMQRERHHHRDFVEQKRRFRYTSWVALAGLVIAVTNAVRSCLHSPNPKSSPTEATSLSK